MELRYFGAGVSSTRTQRCHSHALPCIYGAGPCSEIGTRHHREWGEQECHFTASPCLRRDKYLTIPPSLQLLFSEKPIFEPHLSPIQPSPSQPVKRQKCTPRSCSSPWRSLPLAPTPFLKVAMLVCLGHCRQLMLLVDVGTFSAKL